MADENWFDESQTGAGQYVAEQIAADDAAKAAAGAASSRQLNSAATLSSGSGSPSALAGTAGDIYFRTGTPSTTNQRIYICTVTGAASAATWVGIV